jgi:hypothetical protein
MRPTRAYIASLGTTGVLVGSSLLLLVVVSTLVAFNGWPGRQVAGDLDSLVVTPRPVSRDVSRSAQAARTARREAAAAARAAAGGLAAAGGSPGAAGGSTSSARGAVPATGEQLGARERSALRQAPTPGAPGRSVPPRSPLRLPLRLPQDVPTLTGSLADTTEGLTAQLGGTVGVLNPQLGRTVAGAGKSLSDLVRDLGGRLGRTRR